VKSSVIESPSPINYLAVHLKAGERWRYEPPEGHTVLWTAIASGAVSVPDELQHGDLAAFEPSSEAVEFEARTDVEFVLGSAVPHDLDLVLGNYSVHTTRAALKWPRRPFRRSGNAWLKKACSSAEGSVGSTCVSKPTVSARTSARTQPRMGSAAL